MRKLWNLKQLKKFKLVINELLFPRKEKGQFYSALGSVENKGIEKFSRNLGKKMDFFLT